MTNHWAMSTPSVWGKTHVVETNKIKLKCPSPMKLGGILKTWIVLSNTALEYKNWTPLVYELDIIDGDILLRIEQESNIGYEYEQAKPQLRTTLTAITIDDGVHEELISVSVGRGQDIQNKIYTNLLNSVVYQFKKLIEATEYHGVRLSHNQLKTIHHWHEGFRLMPRE